jgi:hypothetical protein
VKRAMQDQNTKLVFDGVSKLRGLVRGAIVRNRDLAQRTVRSTWREGKHVRSIILPAKGPIQRLKFIVAGNQANDTSSAAYVCRNLGNESPKLAPPHLS